MFADLEVKPEDYEDRAGSDTEDGRMNEDGLKKLMDGFKSECEKPLGLSVVPKYYVGESFMPSRFVAGYGNLSPWQEVRDIKDIEEFLAVTKSMNGNIDLDGWVYVYIDDFVIDGSTSNCKAVCERVNARSEFNKIDDDFLSQFQSRNKSRKKRRKTW